MTKANEAKYADYMAATQRDDESVGASFLILRSSFFIFHSKLQMKNEE
jgi:hypothetical protein